MNDKSTAGTIEEVLAEHAASHGDTVFLKDDVAELTYGEADVLATRQANALAGLGVSAGDTVAFYMENSAAQAVTSFAVNRLGAIWSPANSDYRGDWLHSNLSNIESDVLVVDAHLLPRVLELKDIPFKHVIVNGKDAEIGGLSGITTHDYESLAHGADTHPGYKGAESDITGVLWTSGTTGKSKGVMQSNSTFLGWSRRHNDEYRGGVHDGDVFYGCTPMYNSGGWIMNIYPALVSANRATIDAKFSVSNFWDRIRHYGANHVMTLGTMHIYLFQNPARDDDADNPLRTIMMNPVVPQMLKPFMVRFGIDRVFGGYGQSEVMGVTKYHSDMPDLKPGSCGYVTDDAPIETKLLDDDDNEVPVGEPGEICVRPRVPGSVFSGYFRQPDITLQTFRNLWHHTGDLARVDEDGELFFVDRKKDSLRHKGRNTSTFEVEHIARQCPGVAQVAAYGIKLPDFEFEEELMLAVVPADGVTLEPLEVCKFIDENGPYFFVPRYVEIVDQLPMTPTNKIQKFKLRDRGLTESTWDRERDADGWQPTRHR